VEIASEITGTDVIMAVNHVTGHIVTGLGACIKNLGMGLASRKGKRQQHSSMHPSIKDSLCPVQKMYAVVSCRCHYRKK
jgi:uncharacterized Fe-S center protein